MPATLEQLVTIRSHLVDEVLTYLDSVALRMAELPSYYPAHLRTGDTGKTRFDDIRQLVQVVEDRTAFEQWLAKERERRRAVGQEVDRLAYGPIRARPETDEDEESHYGGKDERINSNRSIPTQPVLWDERAGEQFTRAIVLGDPGFGKTWLLRYEARRLACEGAQQLRDSTIDLDHLCFPLFARLSDINRSDDPLEDALVALLGTGRSSAFRQFVREKLATDHCVLLFDAWDEVPVEIPQDGQPIAYKPYYRQRLGQRLKAFVWQFPYPRLLLTSRIVGYTAAPFPEVQELELLAFDLPQTEAFARVWFSDDEITQQFLSMLRQNPQVRGLVRIPLMLALMCRAYEEKQLDFPIRRVELYDRCLQGLIRDWKRDDKGHEGPEISNAYLEAVLGLLSDVGYALFSKGYEQFSEVLLRRKIEEWQDGLRRTHEFSGRNPTSLISELKRDGVLVTAAEHGDAILLFLHRTFHEYLTACYLAKRGNEEGWTALLNIVRKKAWLPAWREVIVLLAGKMNDPEPLLDLLTTEKTDDYFRHHLALAAHCLPELSAQICNRLSVRVNYITYDTFTLWWQYAENGTTRAVPNLTSALSALGYVNGKIKEVRLLTHLARLLADNNVKVRLIALTAVQNIGLAPKFLSHLKRMLDSRKNEVRQTAIEALGAVGSAAATPEILAQLERLLIDSDGSMQWAAARAIEGIGSAAATPEILAQLARLIINSGMAVRHAAVQALGGIGSAAATPEVLAQLVRVLTDSDEVLGQTAVETLRRIGGAAANPHFLAQLTDMLSSKTSLTRQMAAKAVGGIGWAAATPKILTALIQISDSDWSTSKAAVETLGRLGRSAAAPEVLAQLANMLQGPNWLVQKAAAKAVGGIGSAAATPEILYYLVNLLRDPPSEWTQRAAAEGVAGIGNAAATLEILAQLTVILRTACTWRPLEAAAVAVGGIGSAAATPEILSHLTKILRNSDGNTQQVVMEAIGGLGIAAATPGLLAQLKSLRDSSDFWVRREAQKTLERLIGTSDSPVTSEHLFVLGWKLTSSDKKERQEAAEKIRKLTTQGVRIFQVPGRTLFRSSKEWVARSVEELSQEKEQS